MSKEVSNGGMSMSGVLFIVFLVLKLIGAISWSWWWVTSPLWIGISVVLLYLLVMGVALSIVGLIAAIIGR